MEERFRAWFFDSALIEKVFKCLKSFAIVNDCVYRDVMSTVKISLSWPEKLKSQKNFSACVLSLMYDGKDLTIGVIILSK